jgi:hypothetical protein
MMISLSEGLGQFFKILMLYDVKVKNQFFGERLELIILCFDDMLVKISESISSREEIGNFFCLRLSS